MRNSAFDTLIFGANVVNQPPQIPLASEEGPCTGSGIKVIEMGLVQVKLKSEMFGVFLYFLALNMSFLASHGCFGFAICFSRSNNAAGRLNPFEELLLIHYTSPKKDNTHTLTSD